jgi:hypothetical protein
MFSNWSTMSEADEGDILDLLDRLIISVRKLSIQVNMAEKETYSVCWMIYSNQPKAPSTLHLKSIYLLSSLTHLRIFFKLQSSLPL